MFHDADIEKALDFSRGPHRRSHWPETLIHRVDILSHLRPDEPAVRSREGDVVSYGELMRWSNAIAVSLITAGAVSGSRVAVLQEPTARWIASILAIMKIGAVYLLWISACQRSASLP